MTADADRILPSILRAGGGRDDPALAEFIGRLADDREHGLDSIRFLLHHPKPKVRSWAIAIGSQLFGGDSVPEILPLLKDKNRQVWKDAVSTISRFDPEMLRPLFADIVGHLQSARDEDAAPWLFALARLGGAESADVIRAFGNAPSRWPYYKRMSSVLADYVDHGPERLVARLVNHDTHDDMSALCGAVLVLLEPIQAKLALAACYESAPDEDCRERCRRTLEGFDQYRARKGQ